MDYESWIETSVGAPVTTLRRRPGGGRHQAFDVALADTGDGGRELFLRADAFDPPAHELYTLRREAEIYKALAQTGIPVPAVLAIHPDRPAVLMEKVEGSARFAGLGTDQQEAIVADFLPILARLHSLDVTKLELPSLLPARSIAEHVVDELDAWEGRLDATGRAQPFLRACFRWLRTHVPDVSGPPSLVQGDTGPGNFLHDGGRVTAVLDWELAHLGDPLEDLAWVATRNAQEPLPDYAGFVRGYESLRGPVDLRRLRYHMVFAELRIAVLAANREGGERDLLGEVGNALIYGALHKRLTVEALSAAMDVPLPDMSLSDEPLTERSELFDAALLQLKEIIVPAINDPFAAGRAKGMARILKYLQGADRYSAAQTRGELTELATLLREDVADPELGRQQLERLVTSGRLDAGDLIGYAWSAVGREHQLLGSAMGALAHRHLPDLGFLAD